MEIWSLRRSSGKIVKNMLNFNPNTCFLIYWRLVTKRSNGNIHSSYQYRVSENLKNVEIKRLNYQNLDRNNQLQRSCSADNVVIRTRGFKPSDRHDPSKRHFLEHLTSKILHFDMVSWDLVKKLESSEYQIFKLNNLIFCANWSFNGIFFCCMQDSDEKPPTPINLEKLLTPAMDCSELLQTKSKWIFNQVKNQTFSKLNVGKFVYT